MKIGRTSENDLVLHDNGVSRRHANLVERLGLYFVEDLGSSNGTDLNGKKITEAQQLRDGDRITVGPVEFTFVWVPPDGDEDATRPIRRNAPVRPYGSSEDTLPAELAAMEVAPTGFRPSLQASGAGSVLPGAGPRLEPHALEKASGSAAVAARPERGALASPGAEGETAADRARRRRELSGTLGGQLRLFWSGLSVPGRIAAGLLSGLAVIGMVGALAWLVVPAGGVGGAGGPEPTELGFESVTASFGLGEGVMFARPDQKLFEFRFVSPTRAVAVLHYQARDVSKEEVNVTLNGAAVGWVPPDTNVTSEREIEQILPLGVLRRNEVNQLVFDNVRNPPGREPWRVWNIRLEVIPVPELPPDQLLATARQYTTAGNQFYGLKDVGAENLFKAWQQYRFAWITLEALDEKPDLYQDVRYQLGRVATELDQKCGQLMLDFQRQVQFRNAKRARAVLADVRRRFPTTDHRCHNLALEKAYEHEL